MKNKISYRFWPAILAIACVAITYSAKLTGAGPGLYFFAVSCFVLPLLSVLAVATAGKGFRGLALAGAGICYGILVVSLLLCQFDGESFLGEFYIASFAATLVATAAGWLAAGEKKKKDTARTCLEIAAMRATRCRSPGGPSPKSL